MSNLTVQMQKLSSLALTLKNRLLFIKKYPRHSATSWFYKPRLEALKASPPLAKAAELCYVSVGDGKQQLCALLSPFRSTMRSFFSFLFFLFLGLVGG